MSRKAEAALTIAGLFLGAAIVGVPTGVYLARMLRVPAGQKLEAGR